MKPLHTWLPSGEDIAREIDNGPFRPGDVGGIRATQRVRLLEIGRRIRQFIMDAADKQEASNVDREAGWVVLSSDGKRFRTWTEGYSAWTDNREQATRYARRQDAEAVHEADENACLFKPYSTLTQPEAVRVGEQQGSKAWIDSVNDAANKAVRQGNEVAAALAQPEAARVGEDMHWLLERRCTPPLYLTGRYSLGGQTDQADHAVRFSSKREAQEALRVMPSLPHERAEFFASEHAWVDATPAPRNANETGQDEALREALEPFVRWARWALETHPAICNDRKFRDVPGMLANTGDDWSFGQQLSPDEPRLRLKHFRAALAALATQPAAGSEG